MAKPKAPISVGLCRDEHHRYYWNGGEAMPGATGIIKIIYSWPIENWKLEGVAKRALRDVDILKVLAERGDEQAAIKLLLVSKDESDAARDRGTDFHQWADRRNNGEVLPPPDGLVGEVNGYQRWLDAKKPRWLAIESMVAHLGYVYGGTLDGIAEIDGEVWLLDLKTSKSVTDRKGRVWDEMRMQLAAYANAEFIGRPNDPKRYRIPEIERFGIVHVTPTETHLIEAKVTRADWLAFLQALAIYRYKKESAA